MIISIWKTDRRLRSRPGEASSEGGVPGYQFFTPNKPPRPNEDESVNEKNVTLFACVSCDTRFDQLTYLRITPLLHLKPRLLVAASKDAAASISSNASFNDDIALSRTRGNVVCSYQKFHPCAGTRVPLCNLLPCKAHRHLPRGLYNETDALHVHEHEQFRRASHSY